MSFTAHDLSNRLLNALDNSYNVVDMEAVNEIISILEKFNITKELLETTRLGKHVNELRRKTSDPTLARRAKVLVKRWRDLVIPNVASPGHTGSNRSSAERQVRRLGGTPLTSPALSRIASPAVNSPRPSSRPAWGGYESDSQDVILVDDDPPPPPLPVPPLAPPLAAHKPLTPPVKRPTSPVPPHDEKKAKRDKKPKKRRGHSRAGSGAETTGGGAGAGSPLSPGVGLGVGAAGSPGAPWTGRNGSLAGERRRNGYKRDPDPDPYAALVQRMPPAGAKKVKTTQELLEEIQSRGSRAAASPPASPDVMLIEPDVVKVESPLRNGDSEARAPSPEPRAESPHVPLEDERPPRECTCGDAAEWAGEGGEVGGGDPACPAARRPVPRPRHLLALHHALVPGVNGTRAPLVPHRFAVRPAEHAERRGLFASVVPLYRYTDYADDYCAKNMSRVPLCARLPWTEWAPEPPAPPAPRPHPPPRPYPPAPAEPEPEPEAPEEPPEPPDPPHPPQPPDPPPPQRVRIEPAPVSIPPLAPCERLKPPLLTEEEAAAFGLRPRAEPPRLRPEPRPAPGAIDVPEHRTVERTKGEPKPEPEPELDGRALVRQCLRASAAVPWDYAQLRPAREAALAADPGPDPDLDPDLDPDPDPATDPRLAQDEEAEEAGRDALGRPPRPARFAEWHECARLGSLVALPYVVID